MINSFYDFYIAVNNLWINKIKNFMKDLNQKKQQNKFSISQLKSKWQSFSPHYTKVDSSMHKFYYTLLNILHLQQAKNILEIGCGTGKLIPEVIIKKSQSCYFLATDLCQKMIQMVKQNILKYLRKMEICCGVQQWLVRYSVELMAVNGEQSIGGDRKFDRIICNLVLMLTQNPLKMLNSLYDQAEQGCLVGLTIEGNRQKSNFIPLMTEAMQNIGLPQTGKTKSNHGLYNNLQTLVSQTQWEIIMVWEQNSAYHFYEVDEVLVKFVQYWSSYDKRVSDYILNKIESTLKEKKSLNFPVQMAILKKKKLK